MKKFLIKCSLFLLVILGTICFVFLQADGYSDPLYKRFTSPKQSALILGTSRASQGLMPKVLNENLNRNDIYNYAFTVSQSPYGPTYLKSIKRKLKSDTNDGIFIITVDPWSISSDSETPNDSTKFEELASSLESLKTVDANPNFSYLINNYDRFYIKILYNNSPMFLHDDGWLESSININPEKGIEMDRRTFNMTTSMQENRLKETLLRYNKKTETYKYSSFRLEYLVKTINFLKTKGEVYLVRLPVHQDILAIENKLIPDFNEKIINITNATDIRYFDMMYLNSSYIFNDGNHLNRVSSKEVSLEVAKWIQQH